MSFRNRKIDRDCAADRPGIQKKNINKIRIGDKSGIAYFNDNDSPHKFSTGINLFAFNKEVNQLNQKELDKIEGEVHTYSAVVKGELRTENLDDLEIPAEICLKEGARVIFTANDTPHGDPLDDDLYNLHLRRFSDKGNLFRNGTLGTVVSCWPDEILVATDDRKRVRVPMYTYNIYRYVTDDNGIIYREIAGTCKQYPLRLAYAMTIHKGQGQTYDAVNIMPHCTMPGQLYVALSRVKSIKGMYLLEMIDSFALIVDPCVREFYAHIYDADYTPSWDVTQTMAVTHQDGSMTDDKPAKLGRPAKYPNGTKPVSLPIEAADILQEILKLKVCPKASGFSQNELTRLVNVIADFANAPKVSESVTSFMPSRSAARGRPSTYPNGVRTVSLPVEVAEVIRRALAAKCNPFSETAYKQLIELLRAF